MSSNSTPPPRPDAWFVTTHWSVVVNAQREQSADSRAALETLCGTYWYPLYAYVRRLGNNPSDAEDLTQSFFARLLEKDYLKAATKEKGRFRTFLLMALKRYVAKEWHREHAAKRGGAAQIISLDAQSAENKFALEPSHNVAPDVLFDRQWAMALLEQTMAQLHDEYASSERGQLFELMRSCLLKEDSAPAYRDIAVQLNLTEAAVKMAVHRLRSRYREILHGKIAETVSSPDEVDQELNHLFSSFS